VRESVSVMALHIHSPGWKGRRRRQHGIHWSPKRACHAMPPPAMPYPTPPHPTLPCPALSFSALPDPLPSPPRPAGAHS
jgi:hypothetical protein